MALPESFEEILILGVDPGSSKTGFGLLIAKMNSSGGIHRLQAKTVGVISSRAATFSDRVLSIGEDFQKLLHLHQPDYVVIEKIFLGKNTDSAFKLGHARGVLIYEARKKQIVVMEMATRKVKKLVTGNGGSDKQQVLLSLCALLNLKRENFNDLSQDASDALALAYAFAVDQLPSLHPSYQFHLTKEVEP